MGRFREAVALFLESKEEARPITPEATVLAAHAASRIGEFTLSAHLAVAAERGFRAAENVTGLVESTNLLGVVAFERGEIDDAELRFRQTVELAAQLGCARFAARGANNLANIAHMRGRAEEALALYRRALEANRAGGDHRGVAEAWHNLSLTYRGLGQHAEALDACVQALHAAKLHGGSGLLALALLGRAELHVDAGDFDDALVDLERAEFLAWQQGDKAQLFEAGRIRAELELRRGDAAESYRIAARIHSHAGASGLALIAAEAASIATLALHSAGRAAEALAMHEVTVASFTALGAVDLLTRFECNWITATA